MNTQLGARSSAVTATFSLIRDAEQNESSRLHILLTASALICFGDFFFCLVEWVFGCWCVGSAICCVWSSPQPSLNQEGRSEKRLRSRTSVFLLCVSETPDACLSRSHAKAGSGTMATAGPHMQKAEVSRRAEEVIGFLMAINVVSWERIWLGPCAAPPVTRRGNAIFSMMMLLTCWPHSMDDPQACHCYLAVHQK